MERQFSERQLIRWAVPGWITLFLVILLAFVHLWFNSELRSFVWSKLGEVDGGTIAAVGAAIIVFGFALGFILSQIYFILYWCKWKLCVNLVGGGVDYKQVFDNLSNFKSTLKKGFGDWPAELNSVRTKRQKWEVSVAAAWWRAMEEKKERMVWESRNNYLVAVYHSLGAILVGTYLVGLWYVFAMILPRIVHGGFVELWLPLLINLVILGGWIIVLICGRSNTEVSHRNLMKQALHYFYQKDSDKE